MADPTPPQTNPPAPPPLLDGKPPTLRQRLSAAGPWPLTVLAVAGLGSFTAIALWAPEDMRTAILGAHGLVFTIVAGLMPSPGK